jgi:hypothetical protein
LSLFSFGATPHPHRRGQPLSPGVTGADELDHAHVARYGAGIAVCETAFGLGILVNLRVA